MPSYTPSKAPQYACNASQGAQVALCGRWCGVEEERVRQRVGAFTLTTVSNLHGTDTILIVIDVQRNWVVCRSSLPLAWGCMTRS